MHKACKCACCLAGGKGGGLDRASRRTLDRREPKNKERRASIQDPNEVHPMSFSRDRFVILLRQHIVDALSLPRTATVGAAPTNCVRWARAHRQKMVRRPARLLYSAGSTSLLEFAPI